MHKYPTVIANFKMTQYTIENYQIEIYEDYTFTEDSADNVTQYDFVYGDKSECHFSSVFGIKIFQDYQFLKSAVIRSAGGKTKIQETSVIIETDRFLICCSDTIFCLSIPDLNLLWHTKADTGTCFEIYKYQDSYIVHGELEISRLDRDGKILWQKIGSDVFTTLDGEDNFVLTDNYILATDWENNKYKFDYNGKSV